LKLFLLVLLGSLVLAPAALASTVTVYVQNDSSTVSQASLESQLPVFQLAVKDLASVWGTDAVLTTDESQPYDYAVFIEDAADCFGCLGYHDVYKGVPYSKVFTEDSATFHEAWQIVFTHELDEMLVDPYINHFRQWKKKMWLAEVGDPVENGFYAYFIQGIPISDFITPSWYGGPGPYDFTHKLKRPGQIGRHGYASWWDGLIWQQVFGG
jgi:hypothetical protein